MDSIQLAFTGQYPITSHLEWHNGLHLIAPQEGGAYVDVRAIADGKIIYSVKPDAAPSNDKDYPQNYAAFGAGPEWTDKGMVIIEHTTEIGVDGSTPTQITFYSVYAHLKTLAPGIAKDKRVYRKDVLGKPGQIYGQPGHIHFEICLDESNIKLLLGQDPKDWPAADAKPTKDGRTDVVFGSTYIYLPANTPIKTAVPTSHMRETASQTLNAPQWVQIHFAGDASITSYKLDGSKIGERKDSDAEYDMYKEANTRHNSLSTGDKVSSSPSGWYELLRFGRNLGRGSATTDKDPLPANAAHWRKINTPEGERWADLNAVGTFKFSDADFPAFLGWSCYGDDCEGNAALDQRCDSIKLKALLTREIDNTDAKLAALDDPIQMFAYTRRDAVKEKLRRAICKFPTEFDQGSFEARYGHIKNESYFKNDATGKNWTALSKHIMALTFIDIPTEYKVAQWHFHPLAFIDVMRKCGWLSKKEILRCMPYKYQSNSGNNTTPVRVYFLSTPDAKARLADSVAIQLMRTCRKYGIDSRVRLSHFLAQIYQETGIFRLVEEVASGREYEGRADLGNTHIGDGIRFKGRGLIQTTGRANYEIYCNYRGKIGSDKYTVEPNNQILSTHPFETTDTAGLYWISKNIGDHHININRNCDKGIKDVYLRRVTKNVNGAENGLWTGLKARQSHLKLVSSVLLDDTNTLEPEKARLDVY